MDFVHWTYLRVLAGDSKHVMFELRTRGRNRGYGERQEPAWHDRSPAQATGVIVVPERIEDIDEWLKTVPPQLPPIEIE